MGQARPCVLYGGASGVPQVRTSFKANFPHAGPLLPSSAPTPGQTGASKPSGRVSRARNGGTNHVGGSREGDKRPRKTFARYCCNGKFAALRRQPSKLKTAHPKCEVEASLAL